MILLLFISLITLAVIFWQDLKTRAIWWFLPPVLLVIFTILKWEKGIFAVIGINMLFILLMMLFMVVYTRIRFGKLENPFVSYFGLGDFLFLLALTPLFPVAGFIWFFTAGTVFVLITHLFVQLFRKDSNIPYAGYFSVFTAFYLIVNTYSPELFNLLNNPYGTI